MCFCLFLERVRIGSDRPDSCMSSFVNSRGPKLFFGGWPPVKRVGRSFRHMDRPDTDYGRFSYDEAKSMKCSAGAEQ